MKGWLIYDKTAAVENNTYIEWFIHEAKKQAIDLQFIFREDISIGITEGQYDVYLHGKRVTLPQFAVIRTIEPTLQAHLESCGVMTFNNASTSQVCNHKAWTHVEINKLSIPMVTTYFATKTAVPSDPPLPYPIVVKEATGRSGKQVHYIQNEQEWRHCTQALTTNEFIIQAANVKLGQDVRVFVIGKEIIGAVLRKNDHDFRANFKLGGQAFLYELSLKEKMIIQKIVNHFDFGLVGIDFLINEQDELVFNEIEDVVGSRILSEVSNINLLEKYVTYIKQQLLHSAFS
ncbi:RimK family alpha-L-glutamate ligase [Pseudogracilibacillus auburnensis]|uniref:Gamma-F420-2:alpha-L-glutamate ligase n=1 Tax=Pseudogracilibacillus auburnensis TaxID=1494959 RepID=A0A2V3W2Z3_9BACI|nr:ATP-grasp domain-containing protein [Pseudogracilibacillus auburnensis]PXW86625.1 gamma-F420-2:alpha-L-glutamate ligase [Pseudogracilibacillus auburnensis]